MLYFFKFCKRSKHFFRARLVKIDGDLIISSTLNNGSYHALSKLDVAHTIPGFIA